MAGIKLAGAMAALAMGVTAAVGLGAPVTLPERPPVPRMAGPRIPGPRRKKSGWPFRTRPLPIDPDRERKYVEAVERIAQARLGIEKLSPQQQRAALKAFSRGGSAHRGYHALKWAAFA